MESGAASGLLFPDKVEKGFYTQHGFFLQISYDLDFLLVMVYTKKEGFAPSCDILSILKIKPRNVEILHWFERCIRITEKLIRRDRFCSLWSRLLQSSEQD